MAAYGSRSKSSIVQKPLRFVGQVLQRPVVEHYHICCHFVKCIASMSVDGAESLALNAHNSAAVTLDHVNFAREPDTCHSHIAPFLKIWHKAALSSLSPGILAKDLTNSLRAKTL